MDLGPDESYDAWLGFLQDLVVRESRDPAIGRDGRGARVDQGGEACVAARITEADRSLHRAPRILLGQILTHADHLAELIAACDQRITAAMVTHEDAMRRFLSLPRRL